MLNPAIAFVTPSAAKVPETLNPWQSKTRLEFVMLKQVPVEKTFWVNVDGWLMNPHAVTSACIPKPPTSNPVMLLFC